MPGDNGRTISLKVGQMFRLNLDPNPDVYWTFDMADPSVIVLVQQIDAATGAQWTYLAKKPGQTTITATGSWNCKRNSNAPCVTSDTTYQWTVVVQ